MAQLQRPRLRVTTLVGGVGVLVGALYPLVLTVPDLLPFPREVLFSTNPVLQLISSVVLAIAFGILSFGVPPEPGITGPLGVGSWALFLFGLHQLILDLADVLTTGHAQPGAIIGGFASTAIIVMGIVACAVAAVCVARANLLNGFARWVLVLVAVVTFFKLAVALVRIQEIAILSFQITAVYFVLLAATGVAYAFHGQGSALRRRLHLINEWW